MTQEQEAYMPTLKEEYRAMRKRMADAASAQRHFIDMFAPAPPPPPAHIIRAGLNCKPKNTQL